MKYTVTMIINVEVEAKTPIEAINIANENVKIECGSYVNQTECGIMGVYDENGNNIDF